MSRRRVGHALALDGLGCLNNPGPQSPWPELAQSSRTTPLKHLANLGPQEKANALYDDRDDAGKREGNERFDIRDKKALRVEPTDHADF